MNKSEYALEQIEKTGYCEFIGFNCDNCKYSCCSGWDGESRRCQCCNRRVVWNQDGIPEAY